MNKDLNELKQKYAELGEEIKRLEEAPKPWPQEGAIIFILDPLGVIISGNFTKSNSYITKALTQGNGFRTRAEAESEKHYREVAYKLSQQEGARKFVRGACNYCVYYELGKGVNFIGRWLRPEGPFSIYFETKNQLENAVAAVGEQEIIRAIRWKELGESS